jgi:hypothetical protein
MTFRPRTRIVSCGDLILSRPRQYRMLGSESSDLLFKKIDLLVRGNRPDSKRLTKSFENFKRRAPDASRGSKDRDISTFRGSQQLPISSLKNRM